MPQLSILGDSISTYKGISNDPISNSSIVYNPYFYQAPFPAEKTYWYILIEKLNLTLCVNNSWSGGNLSGTTDSSSGVNRASELSRNDGTHPDIIIVFMGLNDLGRKVDISVFSSDYNTTLKSITDKYPQAMICCVNIPDRDITIKKETE